MIEPLLETLLAVVLALHLLSVNVSMTAPLICIWLHRRGATREDATADRIGRRLAQGSLGLMGVGLLAGGVLLALLWLLEEQSYFDAMRQFSALKYWNALGELLFYGACMAAYLALWRRWRQGRWRRLSHATLAVLAATNLLYHFPPLMAILATIPTRREWIGLSIDTPQFRQMLVDPEIVARVVHVWFGSVAVSGMGLMLVAARDVRQSGDEEASYWAIVGARIALAPTVLQILVGMWVLSTAPPRAQAMLLGGDWLAMSLLALALLVALGLMHQLASIALGAVHRRSVLRSALLLILVVTLMSGVLRRTRVQSVQVSQRVNSLTPTAISRIIHKPSATSPNRIAYAALNDDLGLLTYIQYAAPPNRRLPCNHGTFRSLATKGMNNPGYA